VQPGLGKVNSVAPKGDPFAAQPPALTFTHRDGAVRPHHPMPRELLVRGGQDTADHPWCSRVDVCVCAHKPLRDGADTLDYQRFAGSG
jgi:hypothetical protein